MKIERKKSSKFVEFGRNINQKYPSLRPLIRLGKILFYSKPKFSGWGMKTEHQLPWIDEYDGEVFRQASIDIKKVFTFNKRIVEIDKNNIDTLLWRHWIVTTAVRYAIKFSESKILNFVECGVGEGFSAYFTLKEIKEQQKISQFKMHLYDAWDSMLNQQLIENELSNPHTYDELSIDITKNNLREFDADIVYHKGYIPDSLESEPKSPDSISYLHIDLNAVKPTMDVLSFFLPKLSKNGVILFDDYGWDGYLDTKLELDKFFKDQSGLFLKLPTGQAIYFCR
jgi:hypothetical protein